MLSLVVNELAFTWPAPSASLHQSSPNICNLTARLITSFDFLLRTKGQLSPKVPEGTQRYLLFCSSAAVNPQLILPCPCPLQEPVQHMFIQAQVSFWGLIPRLQGSTGLRRCQLALDRVSRKAAGEQHYSSPACKAPHRPTETLIPVSSVSLVLMRKWGFVLPK